MVKESSLAVLNEYNTKKVHWISPEVQCYCPLGKDFCTYQIEVDLVPWDYLFDYDVLRKWVKENVSGSENTREHAGWKIYNLLVSELSPRSVSVKVTNVIDGSYIVV